MNKRQQLVEKLENIAATMQELFKQQKECEQLFAQIGGELDDLQDCPKCGGELSNGDTNHFYCDDCSSNFEYDSDTKSLYMVGIVCAYK